MSSSDVVAKKYNMFERRQAIPVLYCRGTHYEVGYDVVSLQLVFFSLMQEESESQNEST